MTPLFGAHNDQELPRLDSFIVPTPAESPTPSLPKYNLAPAQSEKPASDPFDDFPTPKGFDGFGGKPGFAYTHSAPANTNAAFDTKSFDSSAFGNQAQATRTDDNNSTISFPSLPDAPLAASSAAKAQARQDVPPPPTPPSEHPSLLQAVPSAFGAPPVAEQEEPDSAVVAAQEQQQSTAPSAATPQRKKSQEGKKKKKRKSEQKKKSSSRRDNKERSHSKGTLETSAKTEEEGDDDMAHDQRPEDTPQPSSLSGMRFEELYRLRGVVSAYKR